MELIILGLGISFFIGYGCSYIINDKSYDIIKTDSITNSSI